MTRKPNFFIVGAPKCGTTALYEYLRRHPEVFGPDAKEPHFFGSDLRSWAFCRDREAYLRLFADAGAAKAVGEASVWYLYSKVAAREIHDFAPDARIIVMLRQPVDMLYSQHSQFLFNGNEDIEDFAAALAAEGDRRHGRRIPPDVLLVEGLYYVDTARYAPQLERYLDVFGRDRVHVILYDDFKADTRAVYRGVLRFLGVDDAIEVPLEVVNPNKRIRSRGLRDILRRPPRWVRAAARLLLPTAGLRRAVRARLQRLNVDYAARRPIDPALRRELTRLFEPDIRRLESVIGRDLSRWTEG